MNTRKERIEAIRKTVPDELNKDIPRTSRWTEATYSVVLGNSIGERSGVVYRHLGVGISKSHFGDDYPMAITHLPSGCKLPVDPPHKIRTVEAYRRLAERLVDLIPDEHVRAEWPGMGDEFMEVHDAWVEGELQRAEER